MLERIQRSAIRSTHGLDIVKLSAGLDAVDGMTRAELGRALAAGNRPATPPSWTVSSSTCCRGASAA